MSKNLLFFLSLLFVLLTAGCHTTPPRSMNAINVGMSRRDVVLLMGTPAKQHMEEDREVLQFALHKDINDPTAPDEPYWVFLENGKVVKHGRGKDFKPSGPSSEQELKASIKL